jgi:hypothetical protein
MVEWKGSGFDGEGESFCACSLGEVVLVESVVEDGSAVFERVKGARRDAALLFTATVERRVVEEVLRLMGGRVVFDPFALRVVVVPSGFLSCGSVAVLGYLSCHSRGRIAAHPDASRRLLLWLDLLGWFCLLLDLLDNRFRCND